MVTKVSVFLCTRKILHGVNVFPDTAEYHVVSNRTDSWGREGGFLDVMYVLICSGAAV